MAIDEPSTKQNNVYTEKSLAEKVDDYNRFIFRDIEFGFTNSETPTIEHPLTYETSNPFTQTVVNDNSSDSTTLSYQTLLLRLFYLL